ncbi:MAG: LD-carboxypeptidase [Clostridioides sp.]|nr:LD-carboxypeptidase [Clostridioides sp.]
MIGVLAPSGALKGKNRKKMLEDIEVNINNFGHEVKFGKTCAMKYNNYFAGDDRERARDLENMFLDDEVDIIICLRGGYGVTRMMDMIDYEIIKKHPKPLVGLSDITGLHLALYKKCGLKTYHGLMCSVGGTYEWDEFSYNSLMSALTFKGELNVENPYGEHIYSVNPGKASGELVGGNLSLLISTLGTEYEIDTKDKILFIEEIDEPLYKIDRMLTQLKMCGKFADCAGVVFGDFKDCSKDEKLMDLFREFVRGTGKPAVYNLQSGHCKPLITLPLGELCRLDADKKTIKFFR